MFENVWQDNGYVGSRSVLSGSDWCQSAAEEHIDKIIHERIAYTCVVPRKSFILLSYLNI
jgi:hypothetical protein